MLTPEQIAGLDDSALSQAIKAAVKSQPEENISQALNLLRAELCPDHTSVTLTKRQVFVCAAALRYALANCDDLNDALRHIVGQYGIAVSSCQEGKSVSGPQVREEELERLADLMIDQ